MEDKPIYVYPSTSVDSVDCGVMDMDVKTYHKGMTLRDYFANSAMQANLTSPELMEITSETSIKDGSAFEAIARVSYQIADAMLKQRNL